MEQMASEIFTDSRDLHGLFEESAFQKEQKKWQFTVWYTQYATRSDYILHVALVHLKILKDRNELPVRRKRPTKKSLKIACLIH